MIRKLALAILTCSWASLAHGQSPVISQPCVGVGLNSSGLFQNLGCTMESLQPTYGAVAQALVTAATATDIACINGANGTVIRVKRVRVSGLAGTAIIASTYITKHTALDTGGTLAIGTALPVPYRYDSNSPAPAATTQAWTANPTINDGAPGIIAAQSILYPASGGTNSPSSPSFNWGDAGPAMTPPILRSATQQVCVNLNAATITAPLVTVEFIWTESTQ